MEPQAIIILCVTIAVFAAFIIATIAVWGKVHLPEGDHYKAVYKGFIAHVVVFGEESENESVPPYRQLLAESAAKAAEAAHSAWKEVIGDTDREERLKEIVVYFLGNEAFNSSLGKRWREYAEASGGYTSLCKRNFKPDFPMPVIRAVHMKEVVGTGEPVIHELCHELLGQYWMTTNPHSHPKVWIRMGEDTVQSIARKKYKANI